MAADRPPDRAEAHVYRNAYGSPCCSACRKRVQHEDQWRCPYLGCRKWFRTRADAEQVKRDTDAEMLV